MLLTILSILVSAPLQVPGPASDTLPAFDTPATRELVERTISASGAVPPDLRDYRATVRSSLQIALSPDSAAGGDLQGSVDEVVSDVRWSSRGYLHQRVTGHRARLVIPLPYTLASLVERPWVVPHLYGDPVETREAYTPFADVPARFPFGPRGPEYYRYEAGDTLRLRVQGELVTVVPLDVRPRVQLPDEGEPRLVVGTFLLDVDRAAIARARFGFAGGGGILPSFLGHLETFLELENALWQGRYWLPFVQRRDISFSSGVLGGSAIVRFVSRFDDFELNTGWSPSSPRLALEWDLDDDAEQFAGWPTSIGDDVASYSIDDFADLRLAVAAARTTGDGITLQLHWQRAEHLFRYNRVEGLYLGVAGRMLPADPATDRWSVYGTAGWAFSESTPRGELTGRWGGAQYVNSQDETVWGAEATVYRRLRDLRTFRPTYEWDWIYSVPALFAGSDWRDYYDVTGLEAFSTVTRSRWSGRAGARIERHEQVEINTERYLFGDADKFEPLAQITPGTHFGLEASVGYAFGPGAFGIGNSLNARLTAEAGLADFGYQRAWALLSGRYNLSLVTLAGRVDAGWATGDVPPQRMFRFGGIEGLRGYENNAFGGTRAVLARSRMLVALPPYTSQPLARFDMFILPPLRPSLVLLGEAGWADVADRSRSELLATGSQPTGSARTTVGVGISILDDALTLEYLMPLDDHDEADERWYFGLTYWF